MTNTHGEFERLRRIAIGALRMAAYEQDRRWPDDPSPETQTDLRALAEALDRGEVPLPPRGMLLVFEELAYLAAIQSSKP